MPVSKVPPAQQFEELWKHAAHNFPGMNKQEFLGKMVTWVKNPKNKLFKFGGTTFMITTHSPGMVEFHVLGADSPKSMVKDAKGAAAAMKKVGAKHLFSLTQDPKMLEVAKATGLPFKTSQSQMMNGNQMQPAYRLDLEL